MPYSRLERMNICSSLYSSYRVIIKVGYSLIKNNQIGHQRQVCRGRVLVFGPKPELMSFWTKSKLFQTGLVPDFQLAFDWCVAIPTDYKKKLNSIFCGLLADADLSLNPV